MCSLKSRGQCCHLICYPTTFLSADLFCPHLPCVPFKQSSKQMSPGRHIFPPYCQWQCFLGACGEEDFLSPLFPPVSAGAELTMGLEQLPVAAAAPCSGVVALQKLGCRAAGLCHAAPCLKGVQRLMEDRYGPDDSDWSNSSNPLLNARH